MSKFGLWWVRWNGSDYESRMTVGSRKATVGDFKERGFDRIVVLSGEGRGINYRGSGYGNGYMDGLHFAHWVLSNILGDVEYYITIPFSDKNGNLRDNPANGFDGSYWRGWIDGVLNVYDPRRIGFYWSYESCLQATINDPALKVLSISDNQKEQYKEAYVQFIKDMSNYTHSNGLELVWIPATGDRGVTYLRKDSFDGIPTIGSYFDYVFVQPNYYQNSICIEYINGHKQTLPYSYEKLVEKIRWVYEELPRNINNPNTRISIEMEADRSILYEYISKTHREENFRESLIEKCGPRFTRECLLRYTYEAKEIAFQYITGQKDVLGKKYKDLAYYFSVDLGVIDEMEGFSRRFGGRYV
ncbi:DUF4855 domain-containing protein [Thermococcus sp.]|uniref:DUF4855 domain-containing protein n=2 Tax=Thermococcus sp. TaxID=35749 RepID=UPI0026053B36|nr:DUF4855 domain-containing protein [Thermococcus sp.]